MLSWQPHVFPVGVGKQNVLHNPFLIEQLEPTKKSVITQISSVIQKFNTVVITDIIELYIYLKLKILKLNFSLAYSKNPNFEKDDVI